MTAATAHFVWGAIEHSESDSSANVLGRQDAQVTFLNDHTPSGRSGEKSGESSGGSGDMPDGMRPSSSGQPSMADRIRDHALGVCSPCRFFSRPAGCRSVGDCSFCHLDHPLQQRPRKKNRLRCKQLVGCIDNLSHEEKANLQTWALKQDGETDGSCSITSAYLRTLVRNKLKDGEGEGEADVGATGALELRGDESGDEPCVITTL